MKRKLLFTSLVFIMIFTLFYFGSNTSIENSAFIGLLFAAGFLIMTTRTVKDFLKEQAEKRKKMNVEKERLRKETRTAEAREIGRRTGEEKYKEEKKKEQDRKRYWKKVIRKSGF